MDRRGTREGRVTTKTQNETRTQENNGSDTHIRQGCVSVCVCVCVCGWGGGGGGGGGWGVGEGSHVKVFDVLPSPVWRCSDTATEGG